MNAYALCRGQQLGDALVHLRELLRQLRDHGVEVRGRRCEPLIELHDDRAQFGVLLMRAVKLQHALQEITVFERRRSFSRRELPLAAVPPAVSGVEVDAGE